MTRAVSFFSSWVDFGGAADSGQWTGILGAGLAGVWSTCRPAYFYSSVFYEGKGGMIGWCVSPLLLFHGVCCPQAALRTMRRVRTHTSCPCARLDGQLWDVAFVATAASGGATT